MIGGRRLVLTIAAALVMVGADCQRVDTARPMFEIEGYRMRFMVHEFDASVSGYIFVHLQTGEIFGIPCGTGPALDYGSLLK